MNTKRTYFKREKDLIYFKANVAKVNNLKLIKSSK